MLVDAKYNKGRDIYEILLFEKARDIQNLKYLAAIDSYQA
jgi:hypothetical protein